MGNRKIKLLVTGASGLIGQEVARQLACGGYRPRLMIRKAGDDCEICHLPADFIIADLRKRTTLEQAVKGVDGIIHLAARATFESYETLKPSILDGSVALMEAAIAAGELDAVRLRSLERLIEEEAALEEEQREHDKAADKRAGGRTRPPEESEFDDL